MKSETFTREEFYNLIWSKPFVQIKMELRYSDIDLIKTCEHLNIPIPSADYWVKIKNNTPVLRTKLPIVDNHSIITIKIKESPIFFINLIALGVVHYRYKKKRKLK